MVLTICPHCLKSFTRIRRHFVEAPLCAAKVMAVTPSMPPPILALGGSSTVDDTPDDAGFSPTAISSRTSTRRRNSVNYSETAKRPRINDLIDTNFPSPDETLGDYIDTHFHATVDRSLATSSTQQLSTSSSGAGNPIIHGVDEVFARRLIQHHSVADADTDPSNMDLQQLAAEAWRSMFASSSVAAVAPAPPLLLDINPVVPDDVARRHNCVGRVVTITMESQNNRVVSVPTDRSMARIYLMCDDAGCPRYLADSLITQLRKEIVHNSFNPLSGSITRRDSFMLRALKSTGTAPPEAIPITLESGQKVTVFRFPFKQVVQEHLLSDVFADLDNLSVNASDPWGKYTKDGCILQDFHDGTWYPESYARYLSSKSNPEDYIFNSCKIYADRTHGDGIEKNSLEPIMMTSSIIRQFKREDSKSWVCLGFVPNLNQISAAARRGQKGSQYTKSAALRDWHRCASVLLQPLKDMQKEKPPLFFRRGDQVKCLLAESPLAAMEGDNKSQDTVGGRKVDYGPVCPRMCRRCLTPFSSCADSVHTCTPVSAVAIECLTMGALSCTYGDENADAQTMSLGYASIPLSDNLDHWKQFMGTIRPQKRKEIYIRYKKLRQQLCVKILHRVFGSHPVDNAFFGLDFGCNPEGIFRATVGDILHTIEEGLIPKFLAVFYGLMGDKQRAEVDCLVELMFGEGHNRSGERNSYPRVSFTRGYTQLTRLSANERLGQLFVLCVLLQTTSGRRVLLPRFAMDFDEKRRRARDRLAARSAEVRTVGQESQPVANPNSGEQASFRNDSDDGEGSKNTGSSDDEEVENELDVENDQEADHSPGSGEEDEGDVSGRMLTDYDSSDDSDSDAGEGLGIQVKRNLDRLDLSYMHTGIYPYLDAYHKERFKGVMSAALTERAVSSLARVTLPADILDYRNVDRPTRMPRPAVVNIEKEHPLFQITEERKANSIKLPMEEFVYLAETIISFTSFLKYGCDLLVSRPTGSLEYDKALELFLRLLVSTVERSDTSRQWNLQKTLELAHFKADILSFGPASGFSTETGERGLKPWCKQPSKTAQRRGDEIYSKQVCERIHEAGILKSIASSKPLDDDEPRTLARNELEARDMSFRLVLGSTTVVHRLLRSGKMHGIQTDFPATVLVWFEDRYGAMEADSTIQLFTELVIPNDNGEKGTTVRAHPNYRSEGAWYDFVYTVYDEADRDDMRPVYPCKLACFFLDPSTQEKMALVQEVEFQTDEQSERESQLFQHWTLCSKQNRETKRWDAKLRALPAASLSDRIYVVDPSPIGDFSKSERTDYDILLVKYNRVQWPLSFLKSPSYLSSYQWS